MSDDRTIVRGETWQVWVSGFPGPLLVVACMGESFDEIADMAVEVCVRHGGGSMADDTLRPAAIQMKRGQDAWLSSNDVADVIYRVDVA